MLSNTLLRLNSLRKEQGKLPIEQATAEALERAYSCMTKAMRRQVGSLDDYLLSVQVKREGDHDGGKARVRVNGQGEAAGDRKPRRQISAGGKKVVLRKPGTGSSGGKEGRSVGKGRQKVVLHKSSARVGRGKKGRVT